jgi:hypothetical protein
MRLKIDYFARANGKYNARIRCIDAQDFPTNHIFCSAAMVGNTGYDIDDCDEWESVFENYTLVEIVNIVHQEINAVKVMVKNYRDMQAPESELIEF